MNDLKANLDMLKNLLGEIHRLHRDLLRECLGKKEAIIKMNIPEMEEASRRELKVAESIRVKEGLRRRVVAAVYKQYGIQTHPAMEQLIEVVPEEYRKCFRRLRDRIRQSVKMVQRVNSLNKLLASQSLSHIQSILGLIRGAGLEGPTYTASGTRKVAPPVPLINELI